MPTKAPGKSSKKSAQSSYPSSRSLRKNTDRRVWYLAIAIVLFSAFTYMALTQPLRPDAYSEPEGLDWWKYPLEQNAFARLPVVSYGGLNDVFALPGTNKVWVVGDGGLIAHSADGGRTWEHQQPSDPKTIPDGKTAKFNFELTEEVYAAEPEKSANIPEQRVQRETRELKKKQNITEPPQIQSTEQVGTPETYQEGVEDIKEEEQREETPGEATDTKSDSGTVSEEKQQQKKDEVFRGNYKSIFFIDENHGWAVGDGGRIVCTEDGGTSWNPQKSGINGSLLSVQFVNEQRGWAVGESGAIVHTEDGGKSWNEQTSGTGSELNSVQFVDDQRGWAVGESGAIVHTRDGGENWKAQTSDTLFQLNSVHFVDDQRGWAVGSGDTIVHTGDGGEDWKAQTSDAESQLFSVHFVDDQRGWAVGSGGTIVYTGDGGEDWKAQTSDTESQLSSVHLVDDQRGWAVGGRGTIIHTRDGGENWKAQTSGTQSWLFSVHFANDQRGWAVGSYDTIVHTGDGGEDWKAQTSGTQSWLFSVHFANDQRGWAVGGRGTIVHTRNGGENWKAQTSGTNEPLFSVHFVDDQRGWAVGDFGTIVHTRNGGENWKAQTSGTQSQLSSVHFVNDQKGWAVGSGGTIVHTRNGGKAWKSQNSRTNAQLRSVDCVNEKVCWAVGAIYTEVTTKDGGENWKIVPIVHKKYPAPWYWVSLLLVAGLLGITLRKPQQIYEEEKQSVADLLATDKPIGPGDTDYLDFTPIAKGISRFMRNLNTEPPLTIAITGPWGSGKSSIMQLLEHDLKNDPVNTNYTVWFNAWHHQKEQHILASLLENIYSKAIPSFWTRDGMKFRFGFVWRKWCGSLWIYKAFILILFGCFIGFSFYLFTNPDQALQSAEPIKMFLNWILQVISLDFDAAGEAFSESGSLKGTLELAGLGGFFTFIFEFLRTARQHKVNPSKLIAATSPVAKMKDFDEALGFRHQFSEAFGEVINSLDPGRLVILIDDLDRCSYENVLEVLESINFLTSSGRCILVLGMDRDRVVQCVGYAFRDIAETMIEANGEEDQINGDDERKEKQKRFAENYLEKLVNIEIPVPEPKGHQTLNLLRSEGAKDELGVKKRFTFSNIVDTGRTGLKVIVSLAIVAAAAYYANFYIDNGWKTQDDRGVDAGSQRIETKSAVKPSDDLVNVSDESPAPSQPSPKSEPVVSVLPTSQTKPASIHWLYWSVPLAAIFLLGLIALLRKRPVAVQDSPVFKQGLEDWHKLIIYKNKTPRAIKRFLNRVRFLAMLQSEDIEPRPSVLEQAVDKFYSNSDNAKQNEIKREKVKTNSVIPEDVLVAFAAIESSCAKWIEDDNIELDFPDYLMLEKPGTTPEHDDRKKELLDEVGENWFEYSKLYSKSRLKEFRRTYRALRNGVKVS